MDPNIHRTLREIKYLANVIEHFKLGRAPRKGLSVPFVPPPPPDLLVKYLFVVNKSVKRSKRLKG